MQRHSELAMNNVRVAVLVPSRNEQVAISRVVRDFGSSLLPPPGGGRSRAQPPERTQCGHEKAACGECLRGGFYLIDLVGGFGCGDRI